VLVQPPEEQGPQGPPTNNVDHVEEDSTSQPQAVTNHVNTMTDSIMENAPPASQSPISSQASVIPQTQQSDTTNMDSSVMAPPNTLPPSVNSALISIKSSLTSNFATAPPHTAQRLAELLRYPRKHYRVVTKYLRALQRVVSVTSTITAFPLPGHHGDTTSASSNAMPIGSAFALGSDESLGGALLTPIAWESARAYLNNDRNGSSFHGSDNGMNAVTQGELLRQEQELGVIPTSQLIHNDGDADGDVVNDVSSQSGPAELDAEDIGPQPLGQVFPELDGHRGDLVHAESALDGADDEKTTEEEKENKGSDQMDVDVKEDTAMNEGDKVENKEAISDVMDAQSEKDEVAKENGQSGGIDAAETGKKNLVIGEGS